MSEEIQLVSDGDGLAVIGELEAVTAFLTSEGVSSKDLGLHRLKPYVGTAAGALKAGSEIAANSGRWVQLPKESAKLAGKYPMVRSTATGLKMGILRGDKGRFVKVLQFSGGTGALLSPAVLAGAAGIMSQIAMQQAMDDITDYLAVIDAKVDDLLRGQKDAVLADMIGVDLVIEAAMTVRKEVGRVSETTWSKVQATSFILARTQGYALRQLDALAEKLERQSKVGDLVGTTKEAESSVREWLAVLARTSQLEDGIAILELDRVLNAEPDDLNRHRLGLKAARDNRLRVIGETTQRLLARMDAAATTANSKVLLHPLAAQDVVQSSNQVMSGLGEFHERLSISSAGETVEARRWLDAAVDVRDDLFENSAEGVSAALEFGSDTFTRAKSLGGKFASGLGERTRRLRGGSKEGDDEVADDA